MKDPSIVLYRDPEGNCEVLAVDTDRDRTTEIYRGCHRPGTVWHIRVGGQLDRKRNKGIRVYQGKKLKIVRDFSGKPQTVNAPLLQLLLDNGYTPVVTVPIIDEFNTAINTENDDVVRVLQQALQADVVINLIEAPGFLENKDDPTTLLKKIPSSELGVREQQVEGRMKRKMLAFRKLFEHGASKVFISDGRGEHPVKDALAGKGTVIE